MKVFLFCLGFFFLFFSPLGQILVLINLLFNDTYKVFFFSFSLGEKDSSVRAPLLDLWLYLSGKLLLALQMFYVTVVSVFLELVRVHYCQKYLGFSRSLRKFNLKIFWFSSPCKDTVCVSIYINVVCVCDIMKYLGFFL